MTKSIAAEACSYDEAATQERSSRRAPLVRHFVFTLLAAILGMATACATIVPPKSLDDFQEPSAWKALASDQVSSSLHPLATDGGKALCLTYDFNGVSGYAAMRRELPLSFPPDYEFDFNVRGSGPANQFEFKLIDASGDNVWWVSKPNTTFTEEWTPVRYKKRHISPAWGPLADKTLRNTQFIEFTVSANSGGKGEVCIDDLRFREREAPPENWPAPKIRADAGVVPATLLVSMKSASPLLDIDRHPSWLSPSPWTAATAIQGFDHKAKLESWRTTKPANGERTLTIDFTRTREFGAIALAWDIGEYASSYDVEYSDDGTHWRKVRSVTAGNGGLDNLLLTESETRYLRLVLQNGPGSHYALAAIKLLDLDTGTNANKFLQKIAKDSSLGLFPRGFSGEQTYWTLVGVDGGHESGLIGEDGAIEVARGGFSITPFVIDGERLGNTRSSEFFAYSCGTDYRLGSLNSWAHLDIKQNLDEGYLPMPSVKWTVDGSSKSLLGCPGLSSYWHGPMKKAWSLSIDAFAHGTGDTQGIIASYHLANDSDVLQTLTLALAIQPFQVNPPVQFLTTPGGVSPIHDLGFAGVSVNVDDQPRVWPLQTPTTFFATPFDGDMVAQHLSAKNWPVARQVSDATGLASGALIYRIELSAHASKTISLEIPMSGEPASTLHEGDMQAWVDAQREQVARGWREKLNRVTFKVPPDAQPIIDTLRTALAHILISRDGVQIRPGTRSYARSWIRDGAMTAEALLRMGHAKEARDFLEWFAPYQFDSGKVPCCVDARGSDPVPENDSHGELIYLIAEVARYTQDQALAEKMWVHVDSATRYMDTLRASERTEANRGTEKFGLLPPSISHEGYSSKPAYSHWDNFWGLTGYNSAIELAKMLDRDEDVQRLTASRDQFRGDILASLAASEKKFDIDYIPGAADLGDFDATSTTIALAPAGQLGQLPANLVHNTFERYWNEFVARRDGTREWKDYTPYEWRNVGAFVRLGWRERAHEAIDYFFKDRRPQAWNQWAEVVGKDYREPRFIGDMPHGWVASDFIRSALDLFAYERESDHSIVLAAGIPEDWLDGAGIAIEGLQTPYGSLDYSLRRAGHDLKLSVQGDSNRLPPGGYVLVWPGAGEPGRTTVNGRTTQWNAHELHIDSAPAEVVIRDHDRENDR